GRGSRPRLTYERAYRPAVARRHREGGSVKRPVAYFAGTGRGVPAKVMTNHDFAALGLETNDEWIVDRTGIRERHIAAEGETTCSMAATAARQAMQRAGGTAGELDAIGLSTA